ncbi:hypothetical protein [Streptomyces europaeiscabiei]|uniref:hypothetical protein n=1 Tax=Streptomyces europaeiscabiei TaxID=146819 RepID=UPI0013C4CA50|nr:hypothetical protein [Streptomyces europaeiscabiei]
MTNYKSELIDGVWEQMGQSVVWTPGTPLSPGDVGVLDKNGGFLKRTTLKDLGLEVEVELDATGTSHQVTSKTGAKVRSILKGDVSNPLEGVPAGNAALGFSFSRDKAFALYAYNARVNRIKNLAAVEEWMLNSGKWDNKWICVAEVTVANPSILAVAAGTDASANIDLGAEISGPADLGKVDAEIGMAFQSNLAAQSVSNEPTAVMWRGRGIKGFWNPHVADIRQATAPTTTPLEIENVELSKVVESQPRE